MRILSKDVALQLLKVSSFLNESLSCIGVCYKYSPASKYVLSDVSFTIRKGERLGLIGSTGSGKSTLADIIMGLLMPSSGCLRVDGCDLIKDNDDSERLHSWQASIAHVPQNIYLADTSVAENIVLVYPLKILNLKELRVLQSKLK